MGEKPEDTEREITHLRGDMSAALDELEIRVRGGLRGVASAEARITGARAGENLAEHARGNATWLGVAGVVAAGAVAYGGYALIRNIRNRNTPQNRLKRGVRHAREGLSEQAERFTERLDQSRRQLERGLLPSGVLLKLDPEDGGYVRVSDARLEPPPNKKRGGRSTVIKKLIWAALLSIVMALGSVVARRVADTVWRTTVREDPPTDKDKSKAAAAAS